MEGCNPLHFIHHNSKMSTEIRKRKWDEPAEGAVKAVKTEESGSPSGDAKPSADAQKALDVAGESSH